MKFLKVACVIAVALCLAGSVYAETQSVKVSGDLTMRGIGRNHYDLLSKASTVETGNAGGEATETNQNWFMSTAEIQVDADLTDNVQTVIRLVNQRDWNVKSASSGTNMNAYGDNYDEFDVMVDLAYVTLKDFIYSPLTLTIGRQDLWFGKGFIVGANMQNPGGTYMPGSPNQIPGTTGNISAPEYTAINSFDSIKAVLDYDPWTITAVYANIEQGAIQDSNGINLWGVNVGYKFDSYKAEMEGYWFWKNDNMAKVTSALKDSVNSVHNLGLRGSFDPIESMTIAAEGAWQCGTYVGTTTQTANRDRSAWAIDASVETRYFTDKFSWKPKLGAEFIWYSGDDGKSSSDYNGWDVMYRGKFDSAIREFVGRFYRTGKYSSSATNYYPCPDSALSNQYQVIFLGSIQPIDSLVIKANYNLFWNQEKYATSDEKSKGFVGQEIDISATWDYTEDVSFGLLAAWFVPGTVYDSGTPVTGETGSIKSVYATDVVGTVKVSF